MNKCECYKADGKRCRYNALENSRYCGVHTPCKRVEPPSNIKVCSSKSRSKNRFSREEIVNLARQNRVKNISRKTMDQLCKELTDMKVIVAQRSRTPSPYKVYPRKKRRPNLNPASKIKHTKKGLEKGDIEHLKQLIQHGTKREVLEYLDTHNIPYLNKWTYAGMGHYGLYEETVLYAAVEKGDIDVVKKLLDLGVDPNKGWKGPGERSGVLWKAFPDKQIMLLLLDSGADRKDLNKILRYEIRRPVNEELANIDMEELMDNIRFLKDQGATVWIEDLDRQKAEALDRWNDQDLADYFSTLIRLFRPPGKFAGKRR